MTKLLLLFFRQMSSLDPPHPPHQPASPTFPPWELPVESLLHDMHTAWCSLVAWVNSVKPLCALAFCVACTGRSEPTYRLPPRIRAILVAMHDMDAMHTFGKHRIQPSARY